MHHELRTAKEDKSNAVLAIHFTARGILPAVLYEQDRCFSYKSGCAMWAVKLINEDWPVVLQ